MIVPCTLAVAGSVATNLAPFGLLLIAVAGVAWALTSAMLESADKIIDDRIFKFVTVVGNDFSFRVAQAFAEQD